MSISILRRADSKSGLDPTVLRILIVLLVLIFVGICLIGILMFLRHVRNKRRHQGLSLGSSASLVENDASALEKGEKCGRMSTGSKSGLTITTTTKRSLSGRRTDSFVHVSRLSTSAPSTPNRQSFVGGTKSSGPASVPEIRITFPDETDETGQLLSSGRVVVVRVGDNGVEPVEGRSTGVNDDGLPPYSRGDDGFVSVNLPQAQKCC